MSLDISKLTPRQTIFTHPNNKQFLLDAVEAVSPSPIEDVYRRGLLSFDRLSGIPIEFREYLPERNIEKVWHPPEGDRFAEYGPEDESWMKPLGLGRVEEIDAGPAIFAIDQRAFELPITLPRGLPFPFISRYA